MKPVVLVEIDANSRLRILQDIGVRVAYIDRRVDPQLVLLPERNQAIEIFDAVRGFQLLSITDDDMARTAAEIMRAIAAGEVVVAGPYTLKGEPS